MTGWAMRRNGDGGPHRPRAGAGPPSGSRGVTRLARVRRAARARRPRLLRAAAVAVAGGLLVAGCATGGGGGPSAHPDDVKAATLPAGPPPGGLSCADGADAAGVTAAGACPGTYVALGDSYASGEADGPYLAGTDTGADRCHRSSAAYPEVVGHALSATYPKFVFEACSGAVVSDFTGADGFGDPPQDSWLNHDTGLVTLTIGGNNVGFSQVMVYCATRLRWEATCEAHSAASVDAAIDAVGPQLTALYRGVRSAAPRARVMVVGYPRLFPSAPPAECGTGVLDLTFAQSDMAWLNAETAKLDATIRQSAAEAGVSFADTWNALSGHELCTAQSSMNAALVSAHPDVIAGSFHPTAAGQQALAAAVLGAYPGIR